MTPDLEVSRHIAAAPDAVFAALTDITRMGQWSPENHRCVWNEGFDTPVVGARFTGDNRNGDKEWTTEAEIVELVPNERFFFDCDFQGFVFAKWGYTIEATDGGCVVTEYTQDLRPEAVKEATVSLSGVEDRLTHNRVGMELTLERLAATVEGS